MNLDILLRGDRAMLQVFLVYNTPWCGFMGDCNNTRAKRVSIEIYGQVWRDQPRGKPKGAQPTRVFPKVDPESRHPRAGKLYATSESECIVITYRRNDCHKHPKSMQIKLEIII